MSTAGLPSPPFTCTAALPCNSRSRSSPPDAPPPLLCRPPRRREPPLTTNTTVCRPSLPSPPLLVVRPPPDPVIIAGGPTPATAPSTSSRLRRSGPSTAASSAEQDKKGGSRATADGDLTILLDLAGNPLEAARPPSVRGPRHHFLNIRRCMLDRPSTLTFEKTYRDLSVLCSYLKLESRTGCSNRSMHPVSISFQPFIATPAGNFPSWTTNVRSRCDFVKLPTIGRSSGYRAIHSGPTSASRSETTGEQDYGVGENDGVIIVDHGSRRQESNLMLNDFVTMFRARTGYRIVEPAHMELAEPTIKEAFGKCVQQGASRIIVSPYFLSPGRHWKQDIPSLAAEASKEHSNVAYIVTAPLGLHELMVDVMNDRIKYCLRHVVGDADECAVCAGTGKCHLYS